MNGQPQGRARRLWLRRRLGAAESAAELLQRKLDILREERDRMRLRAARTEERWHDRTAEADRLVLRAVLLGGRRVLPLASGNGHAQVTVDYAVTMGVRYPAGITLAPPDEPPRSTGGTALVPAHRACQEALDAACTHAAALAAVQVLDTEVAAVRRRVRAIERRRVPALRAALAETELVLEERDREDGARLRRLIDRERP